jgi:hypothetical protein
LPDLNPCDYFLRGFPKDSVYRNNPHLVEELKESIVEVLEAFLDNFSQC